MHHNINMFTTGNTHLKYRKHRVHSAAHKLKIRSSRLVLTTAGTDLDSTDRAAIGGAKNSSASEPLKRPILSLWNSRDRTCAEMAAISCGPSYASAVSTPLWCIFKKRTIKLVTHAEPHVSTVSLLKRAENSAI